MDEALHEWRVYYGISDIAFHELRRILFGCWLPSMPTQDIVEMDMVRPDEFMFGKLRSPTIEPRHGCSIQTGGLNLFAYNDMRGSTGIIPLTDSMNEPLLGNSISMENLSSGFRSSQDASVPLTSSCDHALFAPELSKGPPQRKRKAMARKQEHGVAKSTRPCALCWFSKRSVCDVHLVVYTI